ncbi:Ribosome-recycling factor [Seminavis robusta]|uniref:Ribosome-recycling factor n=1 Tax=Seminavis robusta TaxID=568900 RepID=A0A9N8HSC5_9STRA|nr:Ribosome-recycling factor [Seminavis robusta]|eukprot:Sro1368_g266840.1 Ribosome-recycling factor (332) ;mRNA; f:26777-27772
MISTSCNRLSYLARRSLVSAASTTTVPTCASRRLVSSCLWRSSAAVTSPSSPTTASIPIHHVIVRGKKKSAKMGKHLETLNDMAHTQEREQAQERRQKKKDRKQLKKQKGKAVENTKAESSESTEDDWDDDDDDDNEEDEVELPDPSEIKEKMLNIVNSFEESLKSIRGAEPTPDLFDDIMVHAYDSETPLKAVAQVVITSPTMASVTCFDPSLVKEVRNAIQVQLSLNPQSDESGGDAGVLKVPLPKVSLEVRQKTAQQLNKKAENFRLRIRRVRRRYNSIIKQGKDGKLEHISKDDVFRVAKEIDDVTDATIQKLNDVADAKHATIMDV